MIMLDIDRLHVSIQSAQVLRGLSLSLGKGQMVGLIGRNGAGKTTTLRAIMGHLPLGSGSIQFEGQDLSRLPPHARAGLGIGYMPEDRGLVPELSVEQNILVPLWATGVVNTTGRLEFIYKVLPELHEMRDRRALLLSGGQQKLVALARALTIGTRLLLLDEPFEGVAPALSARLSEVIASLRGSELSVLIAQSDLNHSRSLLDAEIRIERGVQLAVT
jgi:branched-chain amino acid transport system ATP-binding protein